YYILTFSALFLQYCFLKSENRAFRTKVIPKLWIITLSMGITYCEMWIIRKAK
ncbi:conserved hypothetical protein, partial [Listeria marthii FSL S4-120]